MRHPFEAIEPHRRLEEEQRHLLSLFEQAPGFVCFMRGREFIIEMANAACFQLIGPRDILGRPAREALPELEGQGYFELLEQVSARGEPFVGRGLRVRLQRERGAPLSEAFVDFVFQPIRDARGQVTGILAQGQDVTEARVQEERRVAAERKLRDSERRYRMATSATQDAIWDWDLSNDALEWNEGVEHLFGHPLGDLPHVISWWYEHVHPEDRDRVVTGIHAAIDSGARNWRDEYRFIRRDGSYALVTDRGFIDHDASGRPVRMVGAMQDITSRHQAEEALKRSEEQFRTLADSIPQLAWMAEADGAIHWYNRRWYEYTGTAPEEMGAEDGWGWKRVHDPAELPRVLARFQSALRSGEPWEDTFPLRRRDGAFRWHLSRAMPLRDAHGRVVRWFGTNTDIHDQREAERERAELLHRESLARAEAERVLKRLRVSEARLQAIIDNSSAVIFLKDAEGRYALVNRRFEEVTGHRQEDALGRTDLELTGSALAREVRANDLHVLSTGTPVQREETVPMPDGEPRTYLSLKFPLLDAEGRPHAVGGISTDITERKAAEVQLRRYADRLEALHDIDLTIFQSLPREGLARAALSALRQLMGCETARLLLHEPGSQVARLFELAGPEGRWVERDVPLAEVGGVEGLAGGSTALTDVCADADATPLDRALAREGLCFLLKSSLRLGKGLVGSLRLHGRRPDVFGPMELEVAREVADQVAIALEQARLREQLRGEAQRLEQQVRRRTAQLEEANAELEAFSYSVSHDLRAPLRSIEGFTQAVEDDAGNALTERSHRFFGKVRSAAARMAELIDDLLQFSRLSRVDPRRGPVDVTALAREVLSELRARSPERRVEVHLQEGMRALADARLLRVVLENLLGNAWKFTGRRAAARIEVGVSQEGDEQVFRVSDDGAGFDMAYAQKLFGPFQRMHRDEEFPGTGIGLATVQRIVHRHGGRIWAESHVGQGATFFFTLGGP
jgi:PAS domain S-box-containing protein